MEDTIRIGQQSFALNFYPDDVMSSSTRAVSRAEIRTGNLIVIVSDVTDILKYDTFHHVNLFVKTQGSQYAQRATLHGPDVNVQAELDALISRLEVAPVLDAPVPVTPATSPADVDLRALPAFVRPAAQCLPLPVPQPDDCDDLPF
ncbi:hypothetical protein [Deinococcus soli (ex Cha et al. 2016)]|uniref:Uncharacterized protein n=2 Tax=Deinococcus soli (ex Cha et al. 2016) TaxID=1309411 RepID=A0ACC6KHP5_9DEIO|nr:hypothetical protein [Deinococcus soli (ex Cha et al. 2016)]MDR6218764.1 hypothetical protein [Deinococcus soli (ex Cha et al. 2016)]MDR6328561.1 hypothetical protein [Deinococcus soli (ex Cha et al. 2016)]MDR6751952.1 hypothetical protein [Deinococcus soli (ex Cha et al. 2016)]